MSPSRLETLLNRGQIVKICGLREPAHALAAASSGADVLGVVFAPSRRQVTTEAAADLVSAVREEWRENSPLIAGVFVNEAPDRVNAVASQVGLDIAQMHGEASAEMLDAIDVPVIRAIAPQPEESFPTLRDQLASYRLEAQHPICWLVDAWDPVHHGGTGRRADWELASQIAQISRVILAGGLDASNVADAIRIVQPLGVDVSSGVETEGTKDPERIRAFVQTAKEEFAVKR